MGDRRGGGGPLFEAGHLLNFSAFGMGAYSRWALIRINTVINELSWKTVIKRFYGNLSDNKTVKSILTKLHNLQLDNYPMNLI